MALDILPSIGFDYHEIFIKAIEDEAIHWSIFLRPLSLEVWIALIGVALVISVVLTAMGRLSPSLDGTFLWKLMSDYVGNFWIALKANFGGKPSSNPRNTTHRITLFVCLLSGSVIWIAYRASFTSELSDVKLNLPFKDPETLLISNYK